MPAYSGGNRWVGVLALTSPPAPPPLHRMARQRIGARTRPLPYVAVDGRRVSVDVAQSALSLLGRVLGTQADLPRQAECFALARSLRLAKARPEAWPRWARDAVLAYAADPYAFKSAPPDLRSWGLWSSRRRAKAVGGKQRAAPRTAPRTSGSPRRGSGANVVPIRN